MKKPLQSSQEIKLWFDGIFFSCGKYLNLKNLHRCNFDILGILGRINFFCRRKLSSFPQVFWCFYQAEIWTDVVMEPPTEEWRHWGHHHHVVLHEEGGRVRPKFISKNSRGSQKNLNILTRDWTDISLVLKINDRESSSRRIATEASGSSAAEIKLSRELLVDWCGNQGGSGSNEDPCWAGGDVGNRSSIIFIDRPAASDLINDCFVGLLVPPLALQSKCQTPWFFSTKISFI